MTLKLKISPSLERRLEEQASKMGLILEAYALTLIERQLGAEAVSGREVVATRPRRRPGSAKGLIRIPDSFDEPLEDFEAYR